MVLQQFLKNTDVVGWHRPATNPTDPAACSLPASALSPSGIGDRIARKKRQEKLVDQDKDSLISEERSKEK